MAFTDAWYVGSAELAGVTAVFCSNAKSIPAVLSRPGLVAATTWSWTGVAAALKPLGIIDARMRGAGAAAELRSGAPDGALTLGIGPGFVAGRNVDAPIMTALPDGGGSDEAAGPYAERADGASSEGGGRGEGLIRAARADRFATSRRIGELVAVGEIVGWLGPDAIRAPFAGALRGLTARGARVSAGMPIVEVDPRGEPARCFGIAPESVIVVRRALDALAAHRGLALAELAIPA
jgi:xanthine dehydrogenase accessory factor